MDQVLFCTGSVGVTVKGLYIHTFSKEEICYRTFNCTFIINDVK